MPSSVLKSIRSSMNRMKKKHVNSLAGIECGNVKGFVLWESAGSCENTAANQEVKEFGQVKSH